MVLMSRGTSTASIKSLGILEKLSHRDAVFKSIDSVIHTFKSKPTWAEFRQLELITQLWPDTVGKAVLNHTRPLRLHHGSLVVATSSAAWAQNLAFQRKLIVKKLNAQLTKPILDIRFRPGEWNAKAVRREFPSRSGSSPFRPYQANHERPKPETAAEAFQRWKQRTQALQAKTMATCPTCHRPAPEHELRRYSVCEFCTRD